MIYWSKTCIFAVFTHRSLVVSFEAVSRDLWHESWYPKTSFDVLPPCAVQTDGQANTPPVVMVRSSI